MTFLKYFGATLGLLLAIAIACGLIFGLGLLGMFISISIFGEVEWIGIGMFFVGMGIGISIIVGIIYEIDERWG
jgi:hypothetical protein